MRFKLVILVIATYTVVFPAFSQNYGSVEGSIKNQSGQSLIGADVFLEGIKMGASANAKGSFKIDKIPYGTYTLRVNSIGYETYLLSIEVLEPNQSINIQLKESLYELPEVIIERETMTGGSMFIKDIPGSAHYIGSKQLDKFSYNDINRLLRNIPGINLQEEEGFGLRPNIGMRGTGVERSSKITLMEDGILAAPAPYVAPAAYYFPTVGRMQAVEVRKGSSQIKYGPYTTGGAINFISTPVPQDFSAKINLMGGNFGRRVTQASVGQSFEYGGFMVETYQNSADGFKKLDNGGPTGFDNRDYLAKVRINTPVNTKVYQSITFKVGQAKGKSDETYLGLTENDFNKTPYRRYAGSQVDNITTNHEQYSIKYNIIPAKFMDVSITAYRNNFSRNWYKLGSVKYNPLADPTVKPINISKVLENPTLYSNEYSILTGTSSPNEDALFVRNNNRDYYAKGVQSIVGLNFDSGIFKHDIEIGFRYHKDEEDRFQSDDQYAMDGGAMRRVAVGTPGTQDNRIGNARALAGYIQYSFNYGNLMVLPGVRYESIELSRLDYGKADPERTGASIVKSSNKVDVWIPGIGVEYGFTPDAKMFVGIHRGFAPPGSTPGSSPEKSLNYEIGGRISRANLNAQTIFFYNDYENLLGSDLAAGGGGGTGELFNAGEARVYGAEVEINYYWVSSSSSFSIPLTLAYTFTTGEFQNSFTAMNEDWGTVQEGDQLPYLPNHQFTLNVGFDHKLFNVNLSSKYVGNIRTAPGKGDIPENTKIASNFILDFSANYKLTRYITTFCSVNNVSDEVYAVARRPAGLRPGLPRTFLFGVKVNL